VDVHIHMNMHVDGNTHESHVDVHIHMNMHVDGNTHVQNGSSTSCPDGRLTENVFQRVSANSNPKAQKRSREKRNDVTFRVSVQIRYKIEWRSYS